MENPCREGCESAQVGSVAIGSLCGAPSTPLCASSLDRDHDGESVSRRNRAKNLKGLCWRRYRTGVGSNTVGSELQDAQAPSVRHTLWMMSSDAIAEQIAS
mmetsp:Transcript_48800/g.114264  ORF Transcript_48800/g.114264 Transcript_48800/m.114264 type:complete len:101 (+) Transcript_48800:264-566(+)